LLLSRQKLGKLSKKFSNGTKIKHENTAPFSAALPFVTTVFIKLLLFFRLFYSMILIYCIFHYVN